MAKPKANIRTFYVVAPEHPKLPLKKPYKFYPSLSEILSSKSLAKRSNRLYAIIEYTEPGDKPQYFVLKVDFERLEGEELETFFKVGLGKNCENNLELGEK